MALVLMALGRFRFSIPGISYNRLSRHFDYRWEPQWRIGSRPAQQFLGPGEEELEIHGIIFPHYYGGYGDLNAMRAAAMTGETFPLADARGIYRGPWCIRSIHDEQEFFHPNGDPRRVEFDINLVVYSAPGTAAAIGLPPAQQLAPLRPDQLQAVPAEDIDVLTGIEEDRPGGFINQDGTIMNAPDGFLDR